MINTNYNILPSFLKPTSKYIEGIFIKDYENNISLTDTLFEIKDLNFTFYYLDKLIERNTIQNGSGIIFMGLASLPNLETLIDYIKTVELINSSYEPQLPKPELAMFEEKYFTQMRINAISKKSLIMVEIDQKQYKEENHITDNEELMNILNEKIYNIYNALKNESMIIGKSLTSNNLLISLVTEKPKIEKYKLEELFEKYGIYNSKIKEIKTLNTD